jgi:SdrD B-like domain
LRKYPVGGTGNLESYVYLDGNDNGVREPNESGVGGIVVILDGIQAVRTDHSGRYRFDGVADGSHRITLNADMLPLPWIIEAPDKRNSGEAYARQIDIDVRSTTRLDIAARAE